MDGRVSMEQIADMVAYYRTNRGVKEIAVLVGTSPMAVYNSIVRYGGVIMRRSGHYAQPRPNRHIGSTPRPDPSWHCARCGKGDAMRSNHRSYCRACKQALDRESRRRKRERGAE